MFYTDGMKEILGECGYQVKFYNGDIDECDIFFFGTYLRTVEGEYGLYNWMCDCDLL